MVPVDLCDGRYIAFYSSASNLVAGDTNGVEDVFVRDIQTGLTKRVSVNSKGLQGNRLSSAVQFGGLSKFGVCELARSQLRTPLHEQLRDPDGRASVETVALMALRAIEREGRAQTGRQIACTVAPEVKAWIDAAEIDWPAELSNRIGMRWTIDAAPKDVFCPRDKIDSKAL